MNRARVGPEIVAGIAMLVLIGCSDSTASTPPPVGSHANILRASGVQSDGRLPVDVALSRVASAEVMQAASFNTTTIGGASEGQNVFPFGGGFGLASRYQQAYASTQFNSSAPLLIRSIGFPIPV